MSARADRAVRVMVELVAAAEHAPLQPEALAERQGIPLASVRDVLAQLQLGGLVVGRPGPGGGYWLGRPPHDVSVADVMRVVDGPLADVAGIPPERLEYRPPATALREVWLSARQAVRDVLEEVSVAEVASGELPAHLRDVLAEPGAAQRRAVSAGPYIEAQPGGEVIAHLPGVELPSEDVVVPRPARVPLAARVAYLVVGMGLFVTALGLMKAGAVALIPTLQGSVFTDNAWSTLGVGWLGACIVLSGSPVAASSLSLLDGGAIDRTQSFTMLAGSRLGAAFVVLVVGVVYAVRGRHRGGRRAPISIGILSLLMTAIAYVPGAAIGYLLLDRGALDGLDIGTSPRLTSATDALFGWAVDLGRQVLPDAALFPVGLVVLLVGFQLFDRVLPSVGSESLEDRPDAWYTRKWPMFLLGCGVCLLTLSVSVAMTVLVPLVAKGHLRRANTLPYIAGANITTLADTLVAAILLGNQDGVRVVAAVTLSVTVWTVLLIAGAYPVVREACLAAARLALQSRARLAGFVVALFAVPLALIAV
ncbi:MAG TPA: Rrf2 family transcriptional regulator [Acidimicrobiales bacterium]|nr:Rrf2 family transcriptional regulator [Acidimicrobiales bacterium]